MSGLRQRVMTLRTATGRCLELQGIAPCIEFVLAPKRTKFYLTRRRRRTEANPIKLLDNSRAAPGKGTGATEKFKP